MPNTREKLIELLMDSPGLTTCYGDREEFAENADWLIANGVTVQEWISVKERLPDKDGEYLVRFANKSICNVEYESKFGSFGYWLAIMWDEDADWYPYVDITHWMPLPEPPKGE